MDGCKCNEYCDYITIHSLLTWLERKFNRIKAVLSMLKLSEFSVVLPEC